MGRRSVQKNLSYISTFVSQVFIHCDFFSRRFSYTVTITIKDVCISATVSKKKDAKNLAYRNMAIRWESISDFKHLNLKRVILSF